MAQQEHIEPLTGGIKSGENPFLSQEGDSAGMLNVVFRGNQLTPIVGPKMLSKGKPFDAGASTKGVEGLAALPFPDTTYVVAMANDGTLKRSTISKTNFLTSSPASALTWTDVTPTGYTTAAANDKVLATAQYNDNYYLFTGVTGTKRNLVVDHTGTLRQHGMAVIEANPALVQPVTAVPATANGYEYAFFGFSVVGWYTYWCTEVIRDAEGNLIAESAAHEVTAPRNANVAALSSAVRLWSHVKVNPAATHIRFYRALAGASNVSAFPDGEVILEKKIGSTGTVLGYDGLYTKKRWNGWTSGSGFVSGFPSTVWQYSANGAANNFTGTTDTNTATSTQLNKASASSPSSGAYAFVSLVPLTVSFTANTITGPPEYVTGFELKVNQNSAMLNAAGSAGGTDHLAVSTIDVSIDFTNKTGWSVAPGSNIRTVFPTQNPGVVIAGGPRDLWGASGPIPVADFVNNFTVKVQFNFADGAVTSFQGILANLFDVEVVLYLDSPDESGEPYETVVINNTAPISANTPPPNATCGAVFNDSLVVDDCTKVGRIRWSIPGMPESFPEPYYFDVPTTQNDKITGMWVLNNKLIVATDTTMWRINYLPMADDVLFQKGQVAELIDANSGCVGPLAATVYGGMQGRPELAYIDKSGFNSTDGFTVRNVSPDFNIGPWLNQARPFERKVVLINESEESNIFVFAPYREITGNIPYVAGPTTGATGYTANFQTGILVFNYGPAHMNEKGEFKCSGAQSGLMTTTVSQGGTTYNQFIYPGAACLLRNTPILKAWGTGNMHLMLVGFTANGVYGENDISIPVPTTEAQFGAVGWMMPFRNFLTASPTVAVNTSFGTTQTASITVTRPISLEGIGGEYRTLEVYFGPRIETTSLQAQVRFFNLDQTTNTVSYTAMSPNSLTQKQNLNMFSTAQQYRLVYDVNNPSAANSAPHPHVHLLSFLLIRYDGYGKETR